MTPEEKDRDFFELLAEGRALHRQAKQLREVKGEFFAKVRSRGHNRKMAKEIIQRYESDDPLSFHEYDEQLAQVIEKYSKWLSKPKLAQELLRAPGPEKTKSPIASTIPPSPPTKGDARQATAADNASFPGDVSAANNSDTAAAPGEATAAVSAPPAAKADDASVRTPRKSAPVFARYKNGAHA